MKPFIRGLAGFERISEYQLTLIRRRLLALRCRRKIQQILANSDGGFSRRARNFAHAAQSYWKREFGLRIRPYWHQAYFASTGLEDYGFVPEDTFYGIIEPSINPRYMVWAYKDKTSYPSRFGKECVTNFFSATLHSYYDESGTPITKEMLIHAVLERLQTQHLIIKSTLRSGGGRSIIVLTEQDRTRHRVEAIIRSFRDEFVIQPRLKQHESLGRIHSSSLNTLRVVTFAQGSTPVVVSTVARFGVGGSLVDNQAVGGLSCGVHDDGKLSDHAIDKLGRRHSRHPTTGVEFATTKLPSIDAVHRLAVISHSKLPYFQMASWDVAILPCGSPVLIEVNLNNQEINFHQLQNGPLFGSYLQPAVRWALDRTVLAE